MLGCDSSYDDLSKAGEHVHSGKPNAAPIDWTEGSRTPVKIRDSAVPAVPRLSQVALKVCGLVEKTKLANQAAESTKGQNKREDKVGKATAGKKKAKQLTEVWKGVAKTKRWTDVWKEVAKIKRWKEVAALRIKKNRPTA